MSSVEMQPWAQPHILSVQSRAPRLLPCVSVGGGGREGGEKKKGRRGGREGWATWIGVDQRRCGTVERICVTASSKTITPAAPTSSSRTDLMDLTPFSPRELPSQTSSDARRAEATLTARAAPYIRDVTGCHRRTWRRRDPFPPPPAEVRGTRKIFLFLFLF